MNIKRVYACDVLFEVLCLFLFGNEACPTTNPFMEGIMGRSEFVDNVMLLSVIGIPIQL